MVFTVLYLCGIYCLVFFGIYCVVFVWYLLCGIFWYLVFYPLSTIHSELSTQHYPLSNSYSVIATEQLVLITHPRPTWHMPDPRHRDGMYSCSFC